MPAQRELSDQERDWIFSSYPEISPHEIAEKLSVHQHTAIRILVRLGLLKVKGDKYLPGRSSMKTVKQRACLVCKRPSNMDRSQFICTRCRCKQRERGLL